MKTSLAMSDSYVGPVRLYLGWCICRTVAKYSVWFFMKLPFPVYVLNLILLIYLLRHGYMKVPGLLVDDGVC